MASLKALLLGLRDLFPSEIPRALWDGNTLAILLIPVILLGLLYGKAIAKAIESLITEHVTRLLGNGWILRVSAVTSLLLVAFLGSQRWLSALAVVSIASLVVAANWKRKRLRLRWMALIIVVVAIVSTELEGRYQDYLRELAAKSLRVYVVLPFQPHNFEDPAHLKAISERYRQTLMTVFSDLPLHVEILPASFSDPELKYWSLPDSALAHLAVLRKRADVLLVNTASITTAGKETGLIVLTELKCPTSQRDLSIRQEGHDSQARYVLLAVTFKLLEAFRTFPELSLSPKEELTIKQHIVSCARRLLVEDSQFNPDADSLDLQSRVDALLTAPSIADDDILSILTPRITPIVKDKVDSHLKQQREVGMAKNTL